MSATDILYRYFKARELVNENGHAETLAQCIQYDRGVDAVELDMKDKELVKKVLKDADIDKNFDSWLLNVDGHLVLVYPYEQRERYMEIQPQLIMGQSMVQYDGFTHSEAQVMKDFLSASQIDFKMSVGMNGTIEITIPKDEEPILKNAMEALKKEENSEVGRNYIVSKNVYWKYAIDQASKALSHQGVVFIGSEAGTKGIRLDETGAISMNPAAKGRFIPKNDPNYERKVLSEILNNVGGKDMPVKVFYDEIAERMSADMTRANLHKNILPMKKADALKTLDLQNIPSIEKIGEMINKFDEFDEQKKRAVCALVRMRICRDQKIEDIHTYKMSKQDKQAYKEMHQQNINQFAGYKNIGREEVGDERQ